jgi:hypothetical protein
MTMPRARRQARLDPVVRPARDTAAGFGAVVPGGAELRGVAADLLHGLQYSFLAAAMHPDIRFPCGSLEEAFRSARTLAQVAGLFSQDMSMCSAMAFTHSK